MFFCSLYREMVGSVEDLTSLTRILIPLDPIGIRVYLVCL
jgi:hypothetical protein